MVLQQAVQACIDCAQQQKMVFSFVKQGYGGEMVSGKTARKEFVINNLCSQKPKQRQQALNYTLMFLLYKVGVSEVLLQMSHSDQF